MSLEFGNSYPNYNVLTPQVPGSASGNSSASNTSIATSTNPTAVTVATQAIVKPPTPSAILPPSVVVVVPPPAPAPIASFTYAVNSGKAVAFTNTSNNGISYKWAFGDGQTSTQKNPVHIYASATSYQVTLTVTNSSGQAATYSTWINTTDNTPYANFTYQIGGFVGYFTNTSNIYATNTLWNFGDGSTSTDKNPIYTYTNNGSYSVTLTVNGSFTKTVSITIDTQISLFCNTVTNADGYKWYWSLDGIIWTLIGTTVVTGLGVTKAGQGVDSHNTNQFKVTAYNAGGESAASSVVAVQC